MKPDESQIGFYILCLVFIAMFIFAGSMAYKDCSRSPEQKQIDNINKEFDTTTYNMVCYSPDKTYNKVRRSVFVSYEFLNEDGGRLTLPAYYVKTRCIFTETRK